MNKLILCQTPLHFLFSLALQKFSHSDSKITMIWVRESLVDRGFIEFVCNKLNADFFILDGANNIGSQFGRTYQRLSNVLKLRNFLLSKRFDELLMFNDSTPEALYLIDRISADGGVVILGEDGVAIYQIGGSQDVSVFKRLLGRVVYGKWWRPKEKVGWCERLNVVFATYPKLVRKDLSCNDVKEIPSLDVNEGVAVFNACLGSDFDADDYVLCIVPLVDSVGISNIQTFLIEVARRFPFVIFKFHPRESVKNMDNFCSLSYLSGSKVIKNDIPVEIVCFGEKSPKIVVGFRSSALHLIKKISPCTFVYFYEVSDCSQSIWSDFYKQVGISRL